MADKSNKAKYHFFMKKNLTLLFSVSLILTTVNIPAYAMVRPGTTCAKLGTTTTVGDLKYSCVKVGRKLVWDSGVPLKKQAAQATPKPSSATPSTSQETLPLIPTNFSDLYEHRSGIAYGAWSKVSRVLNSTAQELPKIDVYQGPNTSVYVKDPRIPLQFVTRLFPSLEIPKKIVILYWTNQDMPWATAKATELMGATEMQKVIQETGGPFVDCYTPVNCNVGHAHIAADGTAYLGLGNPDHAEGDPNFPKGQKEEIEFYHSLQLFQYFIHGTSVSSKGTITSANFPPAWINVAGENFTFDAYRFENDFKSFAKSQDFSDWMNHQGHPITPEWLDGFLDIKNLNNAWSDDGFATIGDNNCIGSSIIEIFVALKGPSVLLDFHSQMSQGKSFLDVFKGEFGVEWADAAPIISKVIFDKYQNKY